MSAKKLFTYTIDQFYGIQQQSDGSLLNVGSAYDMRNMTTLDGNLAVCNGYTKHIDSAIPANSGRYLKLCIVRGTPVRFIVVTSKYIYTYTNQWNVIHTFTTELTTKQVDYIQATIGTTPYIIISTGETQMVKVDISGTITSSSVSSFGSGGTTYTGAVTEVKAIASTTVPDGSVDVDYNTFRTTYQDNEEYTFKYDGTDWKYNSNTVVLTSIGITLTGTPVADNTITVTGEKVTIKVAPQLDTLGQHYITLDGITLGETRYEVTDFVNGESSATFKVEIVDYSLAPKVADTASVRGGGSNAKVNFTDIYYSRLFSAGDPEAPSRLYYSAAIGSGRTIEDWLSVDGSAETSGGYVEIGDSGGDDIIGIVVLSNQLLIFKRYSVYRLYGNRPSQYNVERVENFSEYMSNASCVVKYGVPYYLTLSGIKYYDGTGVLPINDGVRVLNRFIKEINSVTESKAIHNDNVMYFTCKCDANSAYDDTVLVYDISRSSITVRNGFEVADINQYDGIMYIIDGDGYLCQFDVGDTFNGKKINAYWETQHTDLSAKTYKKQLTEILIRGGGDEINFDIYSGRNKWTQETRWTEYTQSDIADIKIRIDLGTSFYIRIYNKAGSHFHIDGGMEILFERDMEIK